MMHNCQDQNIPADARIEACTALIHSNLMSHKMLGVVYAIRANAYAAKPDNALAIQDYGSAIELMPEFPEAFANRASLLEQMETGKEAAADFERAGLIHLKHGDCAHAVPELDRAVSDDPQLSMALYARGVCHKQLGKEAAAEEDMRAAAALDPDVEKHFAALQ
jgi:tetratricopeptide (TPR) repeat protein